MNGDQPHVDGCLSEGIDKGIHSCRRGTSLPLPAVHPTHVAQAAQQLLSGLPSCCSQLSGISEETDCFYLALKCAMLGVSSSWLCRQCRGVLG